MGPSRLVTIPFSHYCEKARWALDRAHLTYLEEPHLPMLAWAAALRAGGKRTVPVLVASPDAEPQALTDSHDILRFAHARAPDAGLYPDDIAEEVEALEAELDRKLGPAMRRIAYSYLLADREALRSLFSTGAPKWESRTARVALPLMSATIKKGLKVDEDGVARSEKALAELLANVAQRLADGRRWLFGDRFTAADLTFSALSIPLVAPPQLEARLGVFEGLPASMRARIDRYRATPAGKLAMRAYEVER
jgi:glutathione S-transferase